MVRWIVFMCLYASVAFSQEVIWIQMQSNNDKDIQAKAKNRLYPGGSEESDLQVQNPLPRPQRKIAGDSANAEPIVEEE